MADNRLTRQQIYDRIRSSSKEEYVRSEMLRLGFWTAKSGNTQITEVLLQQEATLTKELNQLMQERTRYRNKEAVLKEMRLKRMAEARRKREETKQKRELQRLEKAEAWRKRKQDEIVYLGETVSAGLQPGQSNEALLLQRGLPVFHTEKELAAAAGVDLRELRFLCYHRKVSAVNHYRKFLLPKKSGGHRLISAPMPRIKKVQYWVLHQILNKVPLHAAANGFATGRSIVTNAQPHVGRQVVINADVKDFFPSIHFKRVKGVFEKLGYNERIATILALLCTEAVTQEVVIDGKTYFVQKGCRVLPQGAPGSPAITNILCYQLDKRLQGVAGKHQYQYTRYADDISFSGSETTLAAEAMVWRIRKILQEEGFTVHPDKVRIMRKGARQEVTGIVVNKQPGIPREKLRRFRALLHRIKTKGWEGVQWGEGNIVSAMLGYVNFIKMVDPVKAARFEKEIALLGQLPGFTEAQKQVPLTPAPEALQKPSDTNPPSAPNTGEGDWWKVV